MDEETSKRSELQSEANIASNELAVLRTKEKQLKTDFQRAQEEKKQVQDALNKLRRYDSHIVYIFEQFSL